MAVATWKDLSGNGRDLTLYNAGGTTYSNQPAGPPTLALVMVHSKQLSATEVTQNYNNTKRRYGL